MSKDMNTEAVERAARFEDTQRRARIAQPVDSGRDILAGFDRNGSPHMIRMPTLGGRR